MTVDKVIAGSATVVVFEYCRGATAAEARLRAPRNVKVAASIL